MEAAAAIPVPSANLAAQDDVVAQMFKQASGYGFNTVRIFGQGNSTSFQLQTSPGQHIIKTWTEEISSMSKT